MRSTIRVSILIVALAAATAAAADAASCPARWLAKLPSLVSTAWAQESMKFEPVSPESAAAMERRTGRRAQHAAPVTPAPPASEPQVAEPPEAPSPPEVSRAGDVVRIGSDIHIERGQVVEGDVFALRGDVTVDGHVKGNVATTGGDVHLGPTGRVDGDVMCIGGELTEDPGSFVGGQRVTALRGPGERRLARRIRERLHDQVERRTGGIAFAIAWTLLAMFAAWAITRIAPGRTRMAFETLQMKPGTALGLGFVGLLLLGPSLVALCLAMAILCITIVGIPLALLLIPAYAFLLVLILVWGFVLGAISVGRQVRMHWMQNSPATLTRDAVVGAAVLGGFLVSSSLLHVIPFFGWVAALVWVMGFVIFGLVTMAGAGALVTSKFGQGPEGRWWPPFGSAPSPAPPPSPGYPTSPAPAPPVPPTPATTASSPPPPPPPPPAAEPPPASPIDSV